MGKRSLDDARTFGRSIQPTHDLQPEAGSADGDSVFAILDVNEIEADAQPKKITFTGVANVVGPLLTPTAIPAAGSDTQVQFNDGGFFGADGGLTYDKTTDALSAGAFIPTGSTVPTNGVYLPSANTVALSTNGTGRLFINASGNVGLGGAPSEKLEAVSGNIFLNGTDQFIYLSNDKDQWVSANAAANYIRIGAGNQERLRITSAGLVGIGTTSPGATVHSWTQSAGAATIAAALQNSSLTAGTEVRLIFSPNTNVISDNRYAWIGAINKTGSTDVELTFATAPGGAPGQERMRIDSSGRLLVGTTSANTNGGVLQLSGGITFPATQVAASDANTLDDYEEGTWTPTITFATAGDLSVAYSSQVGNYTKIGRQVTITFSITTSTFTHTTASGELRISGLPFNPGSGIAAGGTAFALMRGITASEVQFTAVPVANVSYMVGYRLASGVNSQVLSPTQMPTGGTVVLAAQLSYFVA